MRKIARRAQGRLIDFVEKRLGWDVVDVSLEETEDYDGNTVVRLDLQAEYEIDESEYKHDPDEGIR